jgi:DNA-binding GntR family transcriptional regulator
MHLLRRRSFDTEYGSSPSRVEHGLIVAALASRNADEAARALRQHVINGFERFQSLAT